MTAKQPKQGRKTVSICIGLKRDRVYIKNMKIRLEEFGYKKIFGIFLVTWFLANIVQAMVMDVISDEAYYALFGQNLAWGYYDHPPLVALLTRASSLLFDGNLGVRFTTVLLQPFVLILIWKTIGFEKPDARKVTTFFIISFSIVMFMAYGVITAPDVPLLFFTALFLYSYKKFLDREEWISVLLLALSMAGLVYSKYQAVLVIGFTVLSNFRLLLKYKFWLAGILALLLLSPHILWQISNGFPSFQYHLVARSTEFRWIYFFEYLPNEMAVFNPFTLGAVVYVLVKQRAEDLFSRNLYIQIVGFIGFFWLTAFRGHVEPHWTIACSIPMIILLARRCDIDPGLRNYTYKYILYSLLLIVFVRLFLCFDSSITRRIGYKGNKEKYTAIEEVAGDLPVIFTGSFQRPSLYPFITGKEAVVISSLYSRQTQFDIWKFEEKYWDSPVFVWGDYGERSQDFSAGFTSFRGFFAKNLQTVNRMGIEFELPSIQMRSGDPMEIPFVISNSYDHDIDFGHPEFPVSLVCVFIRGKEVHLVPGKVDKPIGVVPEKERVEGTITVVVPDIKEGEYSVGLSLNTLFGPAKNSRFIKISLENGR